MKYLTSFKQIGLIFLSFLLIILTPVPTSSDVLDDWPDWAGGKRALKVHVPEFETQEEYEEFKEKVQDAIDTWNEVNGGWSMEMTDDASEADVTIQYGEPQHEGEDVAGLATPNTNQDHSALNSVDIEVRRNSEDEEEVDRTIIHELGHCFRLAHTDGDDDVMNPSNTATTPSPMDTTECDDSYAVTDNSVEPEENAVLGDENKAIAFTPKSGTGITFDDVVDINITSLTGNDFYISDESITWDGTTINALITVAMTASHNEAFNVELINSLGGTENYTGILTVTPDPAPPGLPHAVAGPDIIVVEGQPVSLNGSASYHDAGVFMSGSWKVPAAATGLFHEEGDLFLPAGTYEATLMVKDYYGRKSYDTLNIYVGGPEDPIPTLSEWGIILFALLLLAFGIVFVRRQQLALGGGGEVSGDIKQSWLTNKMLRKFPLVLLAVVPIVSALIFIVYGEITTLDISGILLSSIILAYIYLFLRSDKGE